MDDPIQEPQVTPQEPAPEPGAPQPAGIGEPQAPQPAAPPEDSVPFAQYQQVWARAKRAEEALKKTRGELTRKGESEGATVDDVDTAMLLAKGFSDAEIAVLAKLARGSSKRLRDMPNDTDAMNFITWHRGQKKVGEATPPPSSRPTVIALGVVPNIKEMKQEERAGVWNYNAWKARRASGKSTV